MKHHKLIYTSSYDRGLEHLLNMWPAIRGKYPDATLDIAYGWDIFDRLAGHNPERMQWKEGMIKLFKQDGITEHGRLSKDKLTELRQSCGIWTYPTDFTEINCISALEAQQNGCVPVVIAYAALKESVGSGVMIDGDIIEPETQAKYYQALIDLMGDETRWKKEVKKGRRFVQTISWEMTAYAWHREFVKKDESTKVTIFTPTIRKGFWNIMAVNISSQTYKNIEWIIVDDYPRDRSKIAAEYAKKYYLDIKYYRGKQRSKKRTYGLVNANNTALDKATGELFVFLQDFVLMPLDGIEQLVTLHRKNPTALLAPVDMYVSPKIKPDIHSEDWFHGQIDVVGKFIRKNVRIRNEGLRFTNNPFDFEQNYGAIPVKVAKELGGWYEFYDEGLGFDNTDIAFRALESGYPILLDEMNRAVCIDHWEALLGTKENVLSRARRLNDPRFIWASEMIRQKKLPLIRTQEIDDKIDLLYTIPDTVSDDDIVKWLRENSEIIIANWPKELCQKS